MPPTLLLTLSQMLSSYLTKLDRYCSIMLIGQRHNLLTPFLPGIYLVYEDVNCSKIITKNQTLGWVLF